ncbi:HlyD family secretion protein [Pelagibacterium lentulum]|uniref:Hemolysin secretion protein D n=1 Tax=Pelagibacterium lentulum TaxID=2029865 RepID=A0A916R586_9HYPH|nr:HlyD family secretion protein [Pelagibacterium lentulum]GGA38411.1 hemolysin secretion protein D [Pelagibacterium lentulum]
MKTRLLPVLVLLALVSLAGFALWSAQAPQPLIVQGEVEATRVDIAPRAAGQVKAIHVDMGQRVEPGDLLVELDSPQLLAGLQAAQAQLAVAQADRNRIHSTRPEAIAARRAEYEKAQADLVLAQATYERLSALTERSVASQQQLENAQNSLTAAQAGVEATEANLALATNGASPQERAVADAQVEQAQAAVHQIETDMAELTVYAPIGGEITSRVAEIGGLAGAGAPLLSIINLDDAWMTFNVREDLLDGLAIGDEFNVRLPALNDRVLAARVTAIDVLGSYANWRATKATGDFDLRTFEVRARPVEHIDGLRPGMSAIVEW